MPVTRTETNLKVAENVDQQPRKLTRGEYLASLYFYQIGDLGTALEINPSGFGGSFDYEEDEDWD